MDIRSKFYALFIALAISSTTQAEISSKTDKYLSILIKRPSSDYLFDKFYSSWLENATGADLEKFLDQKFEETKEPIYKQIKAYYLEAEGSNGDALDIYNEIIATQNSASLLFRRAKLQVGTLEFEKAIADLKAASELSSKEKFTIQINKLLGKIYIRDEKKELGQKVWLDMAEKSGDEDLLEEIIELMIDEGLFAEARKQIEKLLTQTKDKHKQVTLTLRLGDIYRTQGNKSEALKKYSETLDKVGTGSWLEKEILSQIEQVFRSEDNLHGLAEYYAQVVKDKTNNIEILKRQATLLFELDDKEKSLKAYQQIVKLTPMSKENKEVYAQQLSRSKKFKEALELVQALVKQYPDDQELYISQAKLYHELKNKQQCAASLFTYIKKDKESEYSFMRAANLLRNFELKDEAKKAYLALIAKYPESREGRMLNALNLYELDEKEAALKEYVNLGKTEQIGEIQRLISTLNTLKENETAFSILKTQHEKFKNNYKYNEILLASANSLKDTKVADQAAQLMLDSADSIADISKACSNIIFAAKKAKKLAQVLENLEEKAALSDKETILLSAIYDQSDEVDTAFEIIETKIKQNPQNELFLEQKLNLSKKHREWDAAIATLTAITQLSPKHKATRIKDLVILSLKAEKTEDALKWIAVWKKTSASSTSPYIQEASIYRNKMDYDKSSEVLKKAMFKFPDNKTMPRLLAQDLSTSGKTKEAKSVYWRMVNKTEDLAEKLGLVRSIIQLSQNDDSMGELTQKLQGRLENNPQSIFPPLALAELHRSSGYYEDRRKFLLKATEIKPNDIGLLREIARIEEEEGQYDRALETIKKIISLDKTNKQDSLLVQFYMRNGEEELAFEQIIENAGGKDMPVEDVVNTCISLIKSRSEKTVEFIRPYLLQHPDDYRISFLYAIALEEQDLTVDTALAFLNVLKASKEVSSPKKPAQTNTNPYGYSSHAYYKEMAEYLPQEAIDLVKNSNSVHNAYSYRRNNRRHYGFSPFGNQAGFPLPKKLEEIEQFIMPHLSTIYQGLEEDEQNEIAEKLDEMGIKYSKLKLNVFNQRNRQQNQVELWGDFADDYKGDKTFEALYAYMLSMQVRTLEDFNAHFEKVKTINEILAVNMIVNTARKKVELDEKYLDFAVKTMLERDLEKLNSSRVASVLLIDNLKEENVAKLKTLMLDTYRQQDPKKNTWGPLQIVRALVKLKDYAAIIDVVNHEDELHQSQARGANNMYNYGFYGYGGRQQKKIVAPIAFPPENSKLIPAFVKQTFSEQNYYNRENPIDKDLLIKEISKVKSTIIRLYIANYCEDEKVSEEIVASFDKNDKSLDKQLFIAAWYGLNEKFKKTVSVLKNARKLCSKKSEKKTINGALVYYIELSEDEELNNEAKLAGERLIALRLSLQEKGDLASSLETLGFTKLAESLDKEIDKATSRSNAATSSSGFSSGRRNTDPAQKVRDYIKNNEHEKALQFAVKEFRKMATSELNYSLQSSMGNNNSWQLKNLMRTVLQKQLVDKFIALLSPKESDSFARVVLERALAYELLKQSDKAIVDYKAVLQSNPDNKAANLRLAFLIADKDPEAAKTYFVKATGKNINFIGPVIGSIVSSMYNNPSIYDIYPVIVELLKDAKISPNQDQYWINNILGQMENSMHSNEIQLPHLFDKKQSVGRSKNKEKAIKILKKREKCYVDLCKVSLKFPNVANHAFGRLEYLISQGRLKDENSFLLAKEVLKNSSKNQSHQSYSQTFYVNNMRIEAKSAEDIFIQHVMANSLIEEEKDFIKSLNYLGTTIKEKIKKTQVLYDCEPKDFISSAEKFLEDNKAPGQFQASKVLIQAHQSRAIPASLTPLIIKQLKSDLNNSANFGNQMTYLGTWTQSLIKNKPNELPDFFDEMSGALAEKIKKMPKQTDHNRHNPMNHSLSAALEKVFGECINSKLSHTIALIQALNKYELSQSEFLFRHSNLSYSLNNIFRKNDDLYDELKATPLFADTANFDAIALPKAREASSILKEFVSNSRNNSKRQKAYLAKLKKEDPKSFGVNYLIVLLEQSDPKKIYAFLDQQLAKIKELPKEQQASFLSSLGHMMKEYPYKNKITSVTGVFRDYETNFTSSSSGDKVAEFLKRKVGEDYYNYSEDVGLLINETVKKDIEKAKALWTHSLKQLRKYQLRQGSQFYGGNSMSEQLFNEIRHDDSYSIAKLRFLNSIISSVKFNRRNKYDHQEAIQQLYSQTVRALYEKHRTDKKTKDQANFLAIKDLLNNKDLFKDIQLPYASLLGYSLTQSSSLELTKLEEFLKNDPHYKDNVELILLSSYLAKLNKDKKSQMPAELSQHYITYLKNEKVDISTRFVSIHKIFFDNLRSAPQSPELNELFYQLCDAGAKSNNSEHSYYYENLLERLFIIKDKDDKWKAATKSIVTLTENKVRQQPDAFESYENSYNEAMLTLLDCLFKLGDSSKTKTYLNKENLRLKSRFETLWILLLNDEFAEAAQLSKEKLATMDSPTNFWRELRKFKIDDKLEKYYASIEDKELNYLARVYYAFAADDKKQQVTLVKEFEQLDPQDKNIRKNLIEIFNNNNNTKKVIQKFNSELFDSSDPLPIIYSDDHNKNDTYATFLLAGLAKMTTEEIKEVASKIKKASMDEDYDYQAENLVDAISRTYGQSLEKKAFVENYEVTAKKLLLLGKQLCKISDDARGVDSLFFTTFILTNHFEGEDAASEWLKSFSDTYFSDLRSHALIKSLNVFHKLYDTSDAGQNAEVMKKKTAFLSSTSKQFTLLFPTEKARTQAVKDISNQVSKDIKNFEDLNKYPPEFATLVAKSNNGYKLWQLIAQQYKNNQKNSELDAFSTTIDQARKVIQNCDMLTASKMNNFMRSLKKEDNEKNLNYLTSIEDKADWLRELEVNLIYKQALDAKAEKCPEEFINYYQTYFSNKELSIETRLQAYYNNYSAFKQTPQFIDFITPLFKNNTSQEYVLNNSFHELLVLSMHLGTSHESSLNSLLKLKEVTPNLGSNRRQQNDILLNDIRTRLGKEAVMSNDLIPMKETYFSLLYNGKHDEFASLFSANWKQIKVFNSMANYFLPSKEREAVALAGIAKLSSKELQLFAKAIYYNQSKLIYKDFGNYRYNTTQSAGNKLDKVVEEFSKSTFSDPELKNTIALLLIRNNKGKKAAKDIVASIIESKKLEDLLKQNVYNYRIAYTLYVQKLLKENNTEKALEVIKEVNDIANQNSSLKNAAHNYMQEVSTLLVNEINSGEMKFSGAEGLSQLGEIANALLKSNDHPYHFTTLIQLLAVKHILNDTPKEAANWIAKMTPKYNKRFREYDLYKVLNSLPKWDDGISKENLKEAQIKVLESPECKLMFKKRIKEIDKVKNRLKLK